MVWKWIKNIKKEKAEKARIDVEKIEFVKRVKINKVLPQYPIPKGFLLSVFEDVLIEIVTDTDMSEDAIKMAGENLAARDISGAGMRKLAGTLERNGESYSQAIDEDSTMEIINILASDRNASELTIRTLINVLVLYSEHEAIAKAAAKVLNNTPAGKEAVKLALEP
jgi:hypothetical protein